jgi:hypothetical protein
MIQFYDMIKVTNIAVEEMLYTNPKTKKIPGPFS